MEAVTSFKYLERVLTASDNDWPEVVNNLRKARRKWMKFSMIWGWGGGNDRTSRIFYKAIVQANLLFGLYTLVMTPRIVRTLWGFHHRVDHYLAGMKPWRDTMVRY